ncbi:uncharacterized protein [Anoplolepis gracilipes]|uniref:uncharacterized protein n=1 Tax=Anoplolepis gracilipes TaxID=354296 RepID=UPI003B9E5767
MKTLTTYQGQEIKGLPKAPNLYADRIFKEAINDLDLGIKVNGVRINTLKYADDTVIVAENVEDLQLLLNKISITGREAGLNINADKTKMMIFSRQNHDMASLYLDNKQIERVASFKYFECMITEDLDPDCEVKYRIEYARF